MKHPLNTHRYYLIYLAIWAVITTAHIAILYLNFQLSWQLSISDALLFELPCALLAYSFGFAFRYLKIGSGAVNSIISYLALIAIGVIIVIYASNLSLNALFETDDKYIEFLANSGIWRISASIFYFSITILSYYLIEYSNNLEEKARNELQLENMLKQTELDALKSQINPHFIFNSLNSISSLTLTAPEKAQDMVIKLSNFLRYCLSNNSNQTNTLSTELSNINLYMEIEKVRFGDRLVVNYQIESASEQAQVPNLILQPLFENAIKYGVYDSLENVTIDVTSQLKNDTLLLTVSNSFEPDGSGKSGEKIGLKNIQDRLQLIYGDQSLLTVSTKSNIFKVTLIIPQNVSL